YVRAGLEWAGGIGSFLPVNPEFNTPYWSLMVEVDFYIVLPILFFLFRRWEIHSTATGIALVLLLVPLILRAIHGPPEIVTASTDVSRVDLSASRFPYAADYFA